VIGMGTRTTRTDAMTVGEVSRLAKVSVRTLHHYDEIGVLGASGRSESGYRLYTMADLERLQQVLLFKELGFALEDIARIMGDPGYDRGEALRAQRVLLSEKAQRTRQMLAAIDAAIAAIEKGTAMDRDEMFDVFGDFDPSHYENEVKQHWGKTDAYRESGRRTARYTKDDWKRVKAESEALEAEFADKMLAGMPADDPSVVELAERHRLTIDGNFYPCSHEFHRNLAEMYIADPRFAKHYDDRAPGLARYVHDAIEANAERGGSAG
jgi:DNA-binding transcriptional MerR regulator